MRLLILGANSDIALAAGHKFAQGLGSDLVLASRNVERLEKKAKNLELRFNVKTEAIFFDALDYDSHRAFYESLEPKPDAVLLAFGHGGHQKKAQADFGEARRIVETNYLGAVSILEIIAADFENRGRGTIMAISSVAGERGRKTNYAYGASKAALTTYLSGLRNRLFGRGVRVVTILPGFVRTKMTEGMDLPGALTAEPEKVGSDILKAYRRSKDVVYTPFIWRLIMTAIKALPEFLFKRLSI